MDRRVALALGKEKQVGLNIHMQAEVTGKLIAELILGECQTIIPADPLRFNRFTQVPVS